jgi:hypothetical protein
MTTTPITPTRNVPLRLVLITHEGVAVYEERRVLASVHIAYPWTAQEIEEVRVQHYGEVKAK